jgi:hypothetical protein
LSVVIGLAATAPSPAAGGTQEAQCGAKADSFLFWPHGHPAIPSIKFPNFRTPHLELYQGVHRASFPDAAEDAYIDSTGAAGVAKRCRHHSSGFVNARVNQARSTTSTHEIICNFHHLVSYRYSGTPGRGSHLQTILSGAAVVVDVKMGPSGSSITWDRRYCTAYAPPR